MEKTFGIEKIILPDKKRVNSFYDKEADVLYLSFGKPIISEALDSGTDTLIRYNPETYEITGVTILNFSDKLKN